MDLKSYNFVPGEQYTLRHDKYLYEIVDGSEFLTEHGYLPTNSLIVKEFVLPNVHLSRICHSPKESIDYPNLELHKCFRHLT